MMNAKVLAKSVSEAETLDVAADTAADDPDALPAGDAGDGAGDGVRLDDRFMIWPNAPLKQFDVPGAAAFRASELAGGLDRLFALVCDGSVLPRWDVMERLRDSRCAGLIQLVGWGTIPWPSDRSGGQRRRLAVIYERPGGAQLVSDLSATFPPMGEIEAVRHVLMPAVSALAHLNARAIVHRGIRPTNLFYRDSSRQSIVLGDCVTTPPGYAQPALFETIESAMACAAGRGSGVRRNDIYSLGVTLLFLLLGHRPAPQLDDEALLAARLAHGSYATLVGRAPIPNALREPLRGMLHDDPGQRWDLEDLTKWLLDRRVKPSATLPDPKALRPFNFEGQNFYNCRSLASAVAKQWRSNGMMDRRVELINWIERSLGDGARCDAVERAYEQFAGATAMAGAATAIFNARLALALDPQAPLRYKDFATTIEGIGPALAAGFHDSARVQEFAEIVLGGLAIFWLDLQRFADRDLARTVGLFRRLASHLKDSRLGFGIERCLYELNPGQHCLSPLVERAHIVAVGDLLPALDRAAQGQGDGTPFDRHIAAFVAARFADDVSRPLSLMANRDNPVDSTIGLLALFATLQWRFGPASLPELTRWMAGHIQPIVATYHHRGARKRIEEELPKLLKAGNLVELYNYLVTSDVRRRDESGFAAAVQQYAKIQFEIAFLESGGASDPSRARRYGQKYAAVCAVALGLLVMAAFTLAKL